MEKQPKKQNRYSRIVETIFFAQYSPGKRKISFRREEIVHVANQLAIRLPLNLGDVIYSFRYRALLPETIRLTAPEGEVWIIRPEARSQYAFELVTEILIKPNKLLVETKVPDATPGIVAMYAFGDEQALLTRLRYNRLIDIFTGVTCYSLQNHLRTTVPSLGQVETDEIYVGIDRRGAHYVFPVQAKGGTDKLHIVQIEQDFALCQQRFPLLLCRPMGAQFIETGLIALFEFEMAENGVAIVGEKHYRLVPANEVSEDDIQLYQRRSMND